MTKKLSQYEQMERRHKKATVDISKYFRELIKKAGSYHTIDILVEDLTIFCDLFESQQADLAAKDKEISELSDLVNKHVVNNLVSIDRIHGLQDKIRELTKGGG